VVNNFIGGGPPEPLGSLPPDRDLPPRVARGSRGGGRFEKYKVSSEPSVDLEVSVGELDGSRGAEEMARKRDEAIAAKLESSTSDSQTGSDSVDLVDAGEIISPETPSSEFVLSDDMLVLAEMEARMLGPISDEHFFENEVDKPRNPEQKPAIQLGGKVSFSDTWNFPPSSRVGVDVLADFFARVEIFDGAVGQIENADRWGRDTAPYEQAIVEWRSKNRGITKRFERNHPEEAKRLSAESRALHAVLDSVRYHAGLIPTSEYRDVARLYGFYLQTRNLPEDERHQAAVREFIDSGGSIVTPLDVANKYRLWEISGAWFGRQKYPRYD
jgi:hypothetical protein